MTKLAISKTQAIAAVDLVRSVRSSWGAMGLERAITELSDEYPFPDVVAAAIRAATNPANKSPESLRWPQNLPNAGKPSEGSGKYAGEPWCTICLMHRTPCRTIAAATRDPHQFTPDDIDPENDPAVTVNDWVNMIKDLVKRP